jgi:hypothetical protein
VVDTADMEELAGIFVPAGWIFSAVP